MGAITAFQSMNGCAGCKHATEKDPRGQPASTYGKGYWCDKLGKAVDAKDGKQCEAFEA